MSKMIRAHFIYSQKLAGRLCLRGPSGFLLSVLLPLTFAAGCADEAAEPTPLPPRPVHTETVPSAFSSTPRSFSGVLKAIEGVDLGFEVPGRLIELKTEEGATIDAGAILARLDTTGFRADLDNAAAQFAAADADLERVRRLYENSNASKSQLDAARAKRETARSSRDIAAKQLQDATLRMPYAGVIGRVLVDVHQVLSAGTPVVSVRSENGLEMEVGIPARDIDSIATGMAAKVSIGALPGQILPAHVSEIATQAADNTTYPVTISLETLSDELREGMDGQATIEIPNTSGETIAIPISCVVGSEGGATHVWVLSEFQEGGEGNRASAIANRQPVRTGAIREGALIEILEGLTEGQQIVSRGVNRVEDGQRVALMSAQP